ncbi:fimbrial protein [Serratia sp. AKBS12]|uniref:fimbrial protein n=1 Tax=Serratia sp. AKBS12 TaxID=2974597 RepID=UPI002166868E|nr:fimbrial protein [Serratia sp. AKBS12]MCS3407303.1 fimbrial protein [Serratia sp. AKBS12]
MLRIKLLSQILKSCMILILTVLSLSAYAACTKTSVPQTEDGYTAIIPFGKINLTDAYFLPPGSHISTVIVPPTNYTTGGASGSSVLWECDAADLPGIYFLVATNGDDRVGGFYDIGAPDGLTDVYATWFAYVGLKQTMAGVTLTRYWKKIPVSSYATTGNGKIQIRLQDIPPLQAELYRISTLPATGARSAYCGNNNSDGAGIGYASSTGRIYSCIQPNAYIQLAGDASVSILFAHDKPGEDSATRFLFWGADNGFGYGMRVANKLYANPTCVARNARPVVMLPTVTVAELEAGNSSNANFTVRVECNNSATSGVADTQTALGFQVSEGAYSAALSMGLVNANGGVRALLSDNYFSPGIAKGVGIFLSYSGDSGIPMTLIGQPGIATLTPGGNAAGWYPVKKGATPEGTSISGYTYYTYNFIATLKKLDGQTVTPGKVHATASVLVKMQ